MRSDYGWVLIAAVLLVTFSQALEANQTTVGLFARGVAIGLSIACSLIGLVLYGRSSKRT